MCQMVLIALKIVNVEAFMNWTLVLILFYIYAFILALISALAIFILVVFTIYTLTNERARRDFSLKSRMLFLFSILYILFITHVLIYQIQGLKEICEEGLIQ